MKNFITGRCVPWFGLSLVLSLQGAAIAAGPPTPRAASSQQLSFASPPPVPVKPAAVRPNSGQPLMATAPGNDGAVERAIQARFARSKISTNGFTVRVQSGVAILEGKTGVIQHKGTATRLAKRAGARRVDNRIQISDAARQRATANLGKLKH